MEGFCPDGKNIHQQLFVTFRQRVFSRFLSFKPATIYIFIKTCLITFSFWFGIICRELVSLRLFLLIRSFWRNFASTALEISATHVKSLFEINMIFNFSAQHNFSLTDKCIVYIHIRYHLPSNKELFDFVPSSLKFKSSIFLQALETMD